MLNIWALIHRMTNWFLGFNPQSVNQFGLYSSVGKSLGINPQNVKITSLGINPHVNLAVIPGHRFVEYDFSTIRIDEVGGFY